jgi:hypothetical protein
MSTIADVYIDDADLMKAVSEALTRPPDYGYYGDADLFGSWGLTVKQSRDSDAMDRSNYRCVLRDLRAYVESHGCDPDDYIEDMHFGHWACGWVDEIAVRVLVDEDGLAEPGNITGAFRWIASVALDLAEQHPIYDDSDHSDLEWDDALEIVTQTLAEIRNDAENAVIDDEDGVTDARLVPEWITAEDVLRRLFVNDVDTPRENHGRYDETETAVWELADEGQTEDNHG